MTQINSDDKRWAERLYDLLTGDGAEARIALLVAQYNVRLSHTRPTDANGQANFFILQGQIRALDNLSSDLVEIFGIQRDVGEEPE